MSQAIWVYIDHFKDRVSPASWETLGAAQRSAKPLAARLTALIIGEKIDELSQEAFAYGADDVIVMDDPNLTDFNPEVYTSMLNRVISKGSTPEAIFFPANSRRARAGGDDGSRLTNWLID